MGSSVGPAVTSTRLPASRLGAKKASIPAAIGAGADQQAREHSRLVGSDSAGDAEQDTLAFQHVIGRVPAALSGKSILRETPRYGDFGLAHRRTAARAAARQGRLNIERCGATC